MVFRGILFPLLDDVQLDTLTQGAGQHGQHKKQDKTYLNALTYITDLFDKNAGTH